MKVLFSPSEAKSLKMGDDPLHVNSFCFPELFDKRLEVIEKFNNYINSSNISNLQKLFGLKDENECLKIKNINLLNSSTCNALDRYTGVAYKYLEISSLKEVQKEWINKNVIIFSNLFGPIKPNDTIPFYKFKQGSSIDGFKPETFYKEHFTNAIDTYIADDIILDLRAGFYEKFYKIKSPYITMKFIKDNKVVSHWAKAYRGIVLKHLAINQISTQKELENIKFPNLTIREIIESGLKREYIFEIDV